VSFGGENSGQAIRGAETTRPNYEDPVYYWDPVIGPSGAQCYTGRVFPEWQGDLFIGGLVAGALARLTLVGDRVGGQEHLFGDRGQRVRDVRQGPDGLVYIVTDDSTGELWRISPGGGLGGGSSSTSGAFGPTGPIPAWGCRGRLAAIVDHPGLLRHTDQVCPLPFWLKMGPAL